MTQDTNDGVCGLKSTSPTIAPVRTIEWTPRGVRIIDQTLLPNTVRFLLLKDERAMWEAIRKLRVRGAPAIGVAAAWGVYLAAKRARPRTLSGFQKAALRAADYLATSRPTAVNLFWALERCRALVGQMEADTTPAEALAWLFAEAQAIQLSDEKTCAAIGHHGAPLLARASAVLTHCNAGALATAGQGTALSVIYEAARKNPKLSVFADETRPLLQGARLTAWELQRAGIEVTLITDSMAATVLSRGMVQAVITGADRIAANGDSANKIGTMPLALAAREFGVPFYIAAPKSTFDPTIATGADIPVEERGAEEITHLSGRRIAPRGVKTFSPAFDVTPAKLITGIITEEGVLRPPYRTAIRKLFSPTRKV